MDCPDLETTGGCLLTDPGCLDQFCADFQATCLGCFDATVSCFLDVDVWGADCAGSPILWSGSACTDCPEPSHWVFDFQIPYPAPALDDGAFSTWCVRGP